MADSKISEMGAAVTLATTNIVPVVQGTNNVFATLGQLINLTVANWPVPTVNVATAAPVVITSGFAQISGACSVPNGTVVTKQLILASTGPGTVEFLGAAGTTTYTFTEAGATISLIWLSGAWNVLSVFNMTTV